MMVSLHRAAGAFGGEALDVVASDDKTTGRRRPLADGDGRESPIGHQVWAVIAAARGTETLRKTDSPRRDNRRQMDRDTAVRVSIRPSHRPRPRGKHARATRIKSHDTRNRPSGAHPAGLPRALAVVKEQPAPSMAFGNSGISVGGVERMMAFLEARNT